MKRLSRAQLAREYHERLAIPRAVAEKYVERRAQSEEAAANPTDIRVEGNAIYLYAPFADDDEAAYFAAWGEPTVSPGAFAKALAEVKGDFMLRINSPGGNATAGGAIGAAVDDRRRAGDTATSRIDGLAASAAAFLLFRTDRITADPMAEIMIHDVWSQRFVWGNAKALREQAAEVLKLADIVEGLSQASAEVVAARIEKPVATVLEWMAEEKYWAAPKALEDGVIDEVLASPKPKPAEAEKAKEEPAASEDAPLPDDPQARMVLFNHRLAAIRRTTRAA